MKKSLCYETQSIQIYTFKIKTKKESQYALQISIFCK
jgi:hypothetical protein